MISRVVHPIRLIRKAGCFPEVSSARHLCPHEVRPVRPRYPASKGFVSGLKAAAVYTGTRAIGERGWPYDHPLQIALPNHLLLDLFVGKDVSQQHGKQHVAEEESEVTFTVADAQGRLRNETSDAELFHRARDISRALRERACPREKSKIRHDREA